MSLEKLVSKYIGSTEHALKQIKNIGSTEHALKQIKTIENSLSIDVISIEKVLGYVRAYLEDAKYYRDKKKFEVSLVSVVYCEGLLDALKLLGAVKFQWLMKRKIKREK